MSIESVFERNSFICVETVVNHNAVVDEYYQVVCNEVVAVGAVETDKVKVENCIV